jgi:hypothetical protein
MPGPLANWVVNATVIITNVNWGFRHPFPPRSSGIIHVRSEKDRWSGGGGVYAGSAEANGRRNCVLFLTA